MYVCVFTCVLMCMVLYVCVMYCLYIVSVVFVVYVVRDSNVVCVMCC